MRYSLIKNGKVENVIEAEPEFIELIRNEWDEIISDQGSKGQLWDGENFTDPINNQPSYAEFWYLFKKNSLYLNLRELAKQDIGINTTLTELMIEINNACYGNSDEERIQFLLDELITDLNPDETFLLSLQQALSYGNLDTVYTININT